ncbi:MAG TPA: HAMP domain-containing sensor histidine kinase [Actinomycetota bacterium]|nr:HAMP domain-containing sensor histidine kinase [Actinomycetota bacterium]
MIGWRAIALAAAVAVAGALGTLLAGAIVGMDSGELAHLAALIAPALLATIVAIALTRVLLSKASMRQGMVAVAFVGAVAAIANLVVLARQMVVGEHDATTLAVLFLYSAAAGVGAALALAGSRARAVDRLAENARRLGEGDLAARVGQLEAGPELDTLARTLDEMAERLQRAQEREREVEATRRDLVTAVSHDLRTPLASLRAMVEAIDEGVVDDPPTMRRYAGEMRRSVDQLVAMVDDLFELAQLDAGAIEAETTRATLGEVVRSAVATVELAAEEKGLSVIADLNGTEELPCSPRLIRVLQNLLVNAVRHTPADGTVRLEAHRSPAGLELVVADTGEGIEPQDLDRVFDPFFRGDPARHGTGAGLGLALAKRIAEALGGTIAAQSEPGHGSRFAVTVPVR